MIKASKDNIHNINATVLNLVREALRKNLVLKMDQSQLMRFFWSGLKRNDYFNKYYLKSKYFVVCYAARNYLDSI